MKTYREVVMLTDFSTARKERHCESRAWNIQAACHVFIHGNIHYVYWKMGTNFANALTGKIR
jgi:hypothetical protein